MNVWIGVCIDVVSRRFARLRGETFGVKRAVSAENSAIQPYPAKSRQCCDKRAKKNEPGNPMSSYPRANARCILSIGIGIAALAICTPVLAQTSPFLTGATALQSNILAWLTPIAIILVMVLGAMAMANRILQVHAAELAAKQFRDREDQQRFVAQVRSALADAVARGEPLPPVRLRESAPERAAARSRSGLDREPARARE
jgi:hypothetical protein